MTTAGTADDDKISTRWRCLCVHIIIIDVFMKRKMLSVESVLSAYTHAHARTYARAHTHALTHARKHACTHARARARTHTHTHTSECTHASREEDRQIIELLAKG